MSAQQPVATVNGKPISDFDYHNAIQGYAMELHRKTMDQLSVDELAEIETLALEKLVARELIFQKALVHGIVADEQAVEAETQKVIANFPSAEEFYATLKKTGIEPMAYHRMLRQDLTVNRMIERHLAGTPEPTAEEISETYRNYPEKMKKPARVRACHILIKVTEKDRELALARIAEIKKTAASGDFAELARQHSQCPSASRGGDLGYFSRGDMVKPFCDAAFSQTVGEVGEVVETQFGFHLIKVIDHQQEALLALDEATPQIREFLKGEAGARRLQDWVADLKAAAVIVMPEK